MCLIVNEMSPDALTRVHMKNRLRAAETFAAIPGTSVQHLENSPNSFACSASLAMAWISHQQG
jgi:hypothetical protein